MIALVVTSGYGNGTLEGNINDVVTRGYSSGVAIVYPTYDGRMTLESTTPVYTVEKK